MTNTNKQNKTQKMVKGAVLVGLAFLLGFISIPIIPIAPWLKIDLSDLPILIGAFVFGPLTGIILEFVKCLLGFFTGSATGGVGELADFIVGVSLILPASFIYHRNKTKTNALIGMIVGIVCMIIVGILANIYILLPLFKMQMSGAQLREYIIFGLLPFNLIKGSLVSGLTYVLYKKLSTSIFKADVELAARKKEEKRLAS
ncbi:ECF transporter S component [uncultured Clostridium sp.]|uniref:ECF transporter S component n=1 Tax=uncultured Clostridium sp. TaxID=59620 RepID=UPI0026046068|nr:ECF transporter S component [uncultured Clostridium sp.]